MPRVGAGFAMGSATHRHRLPPGGLGFLVLVVALFSTACAGHASKTLEARSALDANEPRRALALLNDAMDVKSAKELPPNVGGDNVLFILDRSMVLQELADYETSSRDLQVSDKQIQILDFSRNAIDDLGKYVFSDEAGPYKAPAYEKLMINTMNMVNYLARGDLEGSRVEARRLAVMQAFIKSHKDPSGSLNGPGSYLAGFTFEKSGKAGEALRYYDEALQYGDYKSLYDPIRRLAKQSSYRSPRIRRILGKEPGRPDAVAPPPDPPAAEDPPAEPDETTQPPAREQGPAGDEQKADPAAEPDPADAAKREAPPAAPKQAPAAPAPRPEPPDNTAELLVIVSYGRVPAKYAKRVPIGLALTYASGALSPYNRARADRLALQGLVTWVNYPELGRTHGEYGLPEFALDGAYQPLEGIVAVDREVKKAWEKMRGAVVASAITRAVARIIAGEVTRRAVKGWEGLLLSLGTQAALTAADTPDTRSWATLPARMAFGRVRLPPGTHSVYLRARGMARARRIKLQPGGWAVVALTVLR